MTAEAYDYYILFPNHYEGLRLHQEMRDRGLKCTITPTPRSISSCCGISLLVEQSMVEAAREVIASCGVQTEGIAKVPRSRPAVWNKFC